MSTCPYCRNGMKHSSTKDHVYPKSKFTVDPPWLNIVRCCFRCNGHKGNKPPAMWVRELYVFNDPRAEIAHQFLRNWHIEMHREGVRIQPHWWQDGGQVPAEMLWCQPPTRMTTNEADVDELFHGDRQGGELEVEGPGDQGWGDRRRA